MSHFDKCFGFPPEHKRGVNGTVKLKPQRCGRTQSGFKAKPRSAFACGCSAADFIASSLTVSTDVTVGTVNSGELLENAIMTRLPNRLYRKVANMKISQHVVKRGARWAVVGEGSSRDTSVHDRQAEVIERAREIAFNQGSEVVIHSQDGKIRDKNSYGNDPFPPRG